MPELYTKRNMIKPSCADLWQTLSTQTVFIYKFILTYIDNLVISPVFFHLVKIFKLLSMKPQSDIRVILYRSVKPVVLSGEKMTPSK